MTKITTQKDNKRIIIVLAFILLAILIETFNALALDALGSRK